MGNIPDRINQALSTKNQVAAKYEESTTIYDG